MAFAEKKSPCSGEWSPYACQPPAALSRKPGRESGVSGRMPRWLSSADAFELRTREAQTHQLTSGGGNPAWSDQMRSIAEASVTVASKRSRLDHTICDRRRGTRHLNSHGQSRNVRTPDARSHGEQSRSVGSSDGKSHRGTRSSNIGQIRRKLRQAIPSPMGYPNPSPMNYTGHIRRNTLDNNKDSLASERGCLPIS